MAGYRNPRTGQPVAQPMGWRPIGLSTPENPTLGGSIESWATTLPDRQLAQIEGRKYVDPRAREPIALPPVQAPGMFSGGGGDDLAARAAEGLRLAQESSAFTPGDSVAADMAAAREGFGDGGELSAGDLAAIRAGVPDFLAAGNARREAEDAENQRLAQQALFPGGRSAQDALSADVAFRGLQQSRAQLDPAYNREQDVLDATTFMDPRMVKRRQLHQREGLQEREAAQQQALKLGMDPKAMFLDMLQHQRRKELAEIQASGRGFGGLMGALGAKPTGGIPRGTGGDVQITEADIIQQAREDGWSDEELQATLQKFRAGGR